MLALVFAIAVTAAPAPEDKEVVKRAIVAGGVACAAGNPEGAMAAVDRALVLSYPGAKDRGYDGLAAGYAQLCKAGGDGTLETTSPEFEEVGVIGDVAIARIIWHTRLRGMPPGAVRKMRDVQIWRRTAAGWRFWRGVHWPYSDERPK